MQHVDVQSEQVSSSRPKSDAQGIIAALCGDVGAPLLRCDIAEAERPPARGHWCWVHLDHNRASAHDWLRTRSGIPAPVVTALLAEHTRPRTARYNGGILFIGRGITPDPENDPEDTVSIRAWLTEHRLITVVMTRVIGAEQMIARLEAGQVVSGPAEILAVIISYKTWVTPSMSSMSASSTRPSISPPPTSPRSACERLSCIATWRHCAARSST
jgi:Mg2+ and Co2+ transporter CorA